MLFLAGVEHLLCVWGFADKRESCTYNSVYYLGRGKTTKNTLNTAFSCDNVLVPLYVCMLSSVEIQQRSYFGINIAIISEQATGGKMGGSICQVVLESLFILSQSHNLGHY
jgi:hypothetical protein